MTWFADLSRCPYFGEQFASALVAVGWLERDHEFPRADVPAEFFGKLSELLKSPWDPIALAGVHCCSLCRFIQPTGKLNLFVPASGFLYVAPELITHYVAAHEYAPPPAFQEAVFACPPMRSMAYLKALVANAPKDLLARRMRAIHADTCPPK